MSIQFSDTTYYKGLVQIYEKECGLDRGAISGDTDKLKEFAADCNIVFDAFVELAIRSSGTWQFDDSNQTDYPIIKANIASGQRDYSFTVDGSGNLILDIYRVMVADSTGKFREISPVDQQTPTSSLNNTDSFINEQNTAGIPTRYDKTANGIFLDFVPNYNYTGGLKVFINREPSYFTYSDSTRKPGVPGIFHEYFALKPALKYAGRNTQENFADLQRRVIAFEGDETQGIIGKIEKYYSRRSRDEKPKLKANIESTK